MRHDTRKAGFRLPMLSAALGTVAVLAGAATPEAARSPAEPALEPAIDTPAAARPTLAELAAGADLVALAQVYYTDYDYKRGFPVRGSAYLRILIGYKVPKDIDSLVVYEQGLRRDECYFPLTRYGEDGSRFLVFLARHPDGAWRGHPGTCKVPVAVTRDNKYAIPWPRPEIALPPESEALVREMEFSDRLAIIDSSEMTRSLAERRAREIDGEVRDYGIVYRHGLPLIGIRDFLGRDNLKPL